MDSHSRKSESEISTANIPLISNPLGAGRGQHEVAGSWCDRGHDGEDQKCEGLFHGHVNLREAIL